MTLFTNLIYLLMSMKPDELRRYLRKSLIVIFSILIYHTVCAYTLGASWSNVISVFIGALLVLGFFYYISSNSLKLDVVAIASQREAAGIHYEELEYLVEKGKEDEVRKNTIINLDLDVEDDKYDFSSSLEDTFNLGNSAQMSSAINHTTHKKNQQMGGN